MRMIERNEKILILGSDRVRRRFESKRSEIFELSAILARVLIRKNWSLNLCLFIRIYGRHKTDLGFLPPSVTMTFYYSARKFDFFE